MLELVASEAAGPVIVFEDGVAVRKSAAPILGAHLSSVFGRRNHPVLGGVRMHTGIDFAAPVGTEVSATGAGRVVFAGTIRSYGERPDAMGLAVPDMPYDSPGMGSEESRGAYDVLLVKRDGSLAVFTSYPAASFLRRFSVT